jgi:hypothetical protein
MPKLSARVLRCARGRTEVAKVCPRWLRYALKKSELPVVRSSCLKYD